MGEKISSLFAIVLIIMSVILPFTMYSINPTKAEVERYFEENKCIVCSGDANGEVYVLRRNTGMLWGQIFRIPWWITPKVFFYISTPFNYYNDVTHGEDEFDTYTWVDTRDGRFVYNAVKGEFVKEIDAKVDLAKKSLEDNRKIAEEMRKEQAENSNNVICDTNTYNCDAFSTQSEAQAVFKACPTDVHHLDGDSDGVACETLP